MATENIIKIDLQTTAQAEQINNDLRETVRLLTDVDKLSKGIGLGAKVKSDIEQQIQSVKKQSTEYKALNDQVKEIEKSEKQLSEIRSKASKEATQGINNQAQELKKLKAEINQSNDASRVKELQVQIEATGLALRNARNEAKLVAEQNTVLENSYRGLELRNAQLRRSFKLLPLNDTTGELDRLKREFNANNEALKRFDAELGQSFRKVGNYEEAIRNAAQALKQSAGSFGGAAGLFSGGGGAGGGLLGGVAGLAAGVPQLAAIAGAVGAFGEILNASQQINQELTKTAALTKLEGTELRKLTAEIRASANVFNQDYNEELRAANALVQNFGITFTEALDLINIGLLKGADINGDFLDQLREYGPFFEEAGLSAQKLVDISIRGAQEGIFSDKAADAVKEAAIRLRELTPATRAALKGIGLVVDDIEKGLQSGTLTISDVIAQVAQRLNELPAASARVGTAIADIFGGPGEDAGLRFLRTLKDLNVELDTSTDNLNAYQQQQLLSLKAQEELNEVQVEFAANTAKLGTQLNVFSDRVLADVIKGLNELFKLFLSNSDQARIFGESIKSLGDEQASQGIERTTERIKELGEKMESLINNKGLHEANIGATAYRISINELADAITEESRNLAALQDRLEEVRDPTIELTRTQREQIDQYRRLVNATRDYKTALSPEEVKALTSAIEDQANAAKNAAEQFDNWKDSLKEVQRIQNIGIGRPQISASGAADFEAIFGFPIEDAIKAVNDDLEKFQQAINTGEALELGGGLKALEQELIKRGEIAEQATKKHEEEVEKRNNLDSEEAANRLTIIQESYAIAQDIVNTFADQKLQRLQDELDALSIQEQKKLSVIGDNEQARASIEEEFNQKRKAIQQEQARAEKAAAIFSILLNTARAITAALTIPPPAGIVLAAVVGGLGAVQLANAASRPIPQFFKGTKSSPEGFAWLGERGTEAVRAPGQSRYYLTNDGPQMAYLKAGTEVIPHDKTMQMIRESPQVFKNSLTIRNDSVKKYDDSLRVNFPDNTEKLLTGFKKIIHSQPRYINQYDHYGWQRFLESENKRVKIINAKNRNQ